MYHVSAQGVERVINVHYYYYYNTEKWKCSVNLLFSKSWTQSEQHLYVQCHFLMMNSAANGNWLNLFSSAAGLADKMTLKSRLPPYFLLHLVLTCIFLNS